MVGPTVPSAPLIFIKNHVASLSNNQIQLTIAETFLRTAALTGYAFLLLTGPGVQCG